MEAKAIEDVANRCMLCLREARFRCSECSLEEAWFCCHAHLRLHSKREPGHDGTTSCFPFAVATLEGVGRCLLATRDVFAGEVLFEEEVLAIGPTPTSSPQCVVCRKRIPSPSITKSTCASCHFPVCSSGSDSDNEDNGSGSDGNVNSCAHLHPKTRECSILSRLPRETSHVSGEKSVSNGENGKRNKEDDDSDDNDDLCTFYELLLPLRLLLLKRSNADVNADVKGDADADADAALVSTFMDHDRERRNDQDHWQRTNTQVIQPLHTALSSSEPDLGLGFSLDDVSKAVGVTEVNNFEIYNPGQGGGVGVGAVRGVYPLTSFLSHSCVSNVRLAMSRRGGACPNKAVAAVNIRKGEELTTSYVHLHMSSSLRRPRLKENWYFECKCRRCVDKTELGTFADAVKCQDCNQGDSTTHPADAGYLLPSNCLTTASDWTCSSCPASRRASDLASVVSGLLDEKDKLDRSHLPEYLSFYEKCEKLLHPNHYVLNATRRWLLPLYCRRTRADQEMVVTSEMLERKANMCKKYLFLLDRVEPGLTKNRGRILYELADSLISLKSRLYFSGCLAESELLEYLSSCKALAKEAGRCLQFDEEGTFEQYICSTSKCLLDEIEHYAKNISKK